MEEAEIQEVLRKGMVREFLYAQMVENLEMRRFGRMTMNSGIAGPMQFFRS